MVIFATSYSTFKPISIVGKSKNCSIQLSLSRPNVSETCLQFYLRCLIHLHRLKFEESTFMRFTKARRCFCINSLNIFRKSTAFNIFPRTMNRRMTENYPPVTREIFAAAPFEISNRYSRHLITLQIVTAFFTFVILATF